jgi:ABC-2 type transport system permease protein
VDEDGSDVSRRFIEAVGEQDALTVITRPPATEETPDPAPYTRDEAQRRVRLGKETAAIVIPAGFGTSFGTFAGDAEPVTLIHDPSNPLAQHTVAGLLQAAAMMAAPDVLMSSGLDQLEKYGGALTPEQQAAVDDFLPYLRGDKPWEELTDDDDDEAAPEGAAGDDEAAPGDADGEDDDGGAPGFTGLVTIEAVSAREADASDDGDDDEASGQSIVSYYAAGIGVMFLLFSMAGAAGSLLEEEETGTLERVLTSNVGMGTMLVSYWIFFSIVGAVQLAVMFVWGAVVFGMDLFTPNHLAGFLAMTLLTAPAAAAFGLILATICRSRAQLSGISTVVILVMSALGGSMVPRFVMPDFMNTTALFTFNGWALDGYLKVFWYDDPDASLLQSLASLLPQLAVLAGLTVVFLGVARLFARRWETV